jgi:hypothetical protein
MAATPPLPPDDDRTAIPEDAPPMPTMAPGNLPTAPMPTAPVDRDPQSTLMNLMAQRSGNPMDLGLRDQEHAAFSQYLLHRLGPLLGPAVVATSVPAYSAVKGGAQAMGMMQNATPASMQEVKAGLSPITPQMPQLSMPQLYTLMRLLGVVR